jgi:hypothetical protein
MTYLILLTTVQRPCYFVFTPVLTIHLSYLYVVITLATNQKL